MSRRGGRAFVDRTVIDRCRSVSTCGTDRKLLVTMGVDFKVIKTSSSMYFCKLTISL